MDLALNNLQRLYCHKTQPTNQTNIIIILCSFFLDFKIVYYNNYLILGHHVLDKRGKYFVSLLIWRQNHSKLCKQNFSRKINLNNYPQKSQMYHCVHKFQATGSVNNLNKKTENPISGRTLTARYPDNVDAVRDSVGRSPKRQKIPYLAGS